MRLIEVSELKPGMRIANQLYNHKGVLLFSKGTELKASSIEAIQKLNFFGVYILEPAEPLPPISEEDEEYEAFLTTSSYTLAAILQNIIDGKESKELEQLASNIITKFGKINHKINFLQSLRNPDDQLYRHSISVAILTTLITSKLNIPYQEQQAIVITALLHDIGKLFAPKDIVNKRDVLSGKELLAIRIAEKRGYELIKNSYSFPANIKRYFIQMYYEANSKIEDHITPEEINKRLLGTKIVKIADLFDLLTALRVYKAPITEYAAVQFFYKNDLEFDESIVDIIVDSINILPVGACVELTNGEKGLVISQNEYYTLRPNVLGFDTNTIYDLGHRKVYEQVQIKDIMKTMDNRFMMNRSNE